MNTALTKTQRFFIRILRDHLNQTPTEPIEEIDWPELAELACKHSVNGILYHQCRGFLPPALYPRLTQLYASELYYYRNRLEIFNRLSDALSAAGIMFYTVKGLDVAALYPYPALRTMGDCDIVVHTGDRERAHDVLLEQGLECRSANANEWVFHQDDFEFELHDQLLYDEYFNKSAERSFTERAWEYVTPLSGTRYDLEPGFHYVFLLLHLKKHFIFQGVGIRQFMDLFEAGKKWTLDRDWLDSALKELHLERFNSVCNALTEYWFGDSAGESREDYDEMTRKILDNGTFGFHDEANESNRRNVSLVSGRGPLWWLRIKKLIRNVFPSYKEMRYADCYRPLDGRPWLLPVFWLYRFYRAIRYRKLDSGKRMVEDASVSKSTLQDFENELKKWGISASDS